MRGHIPVLLTSSRKMLNIFNYHYAIQEEVGHNLTFAHKSGLIVHGSIDNTVQLESIKGDEMHEERRYRAIPRQSIRHTFGEIGNFLLRMVKTVLSIRC